MSTDEVRRSVENTARFQNALKKFRGSLATRSEARNMPILDGFRQFLDLIVIIFGMKQDRQPVNSVGNRKVYPTLSQNSMNFDLQTAKNRTCILTCSLYILHSVSLPAFAHCGRRT